jgi:CRP/FNR family transcriptional regulator, anaerobic regulatory protein
MNIAQKIKQTFDPYFVVPIEAWKSFTELGELIEIPNNMTVKRNDTTEKYLHFILEGCGGILLWNKNNFVCIDLSFEGDFFSDYMSFLSQKPTSLEVVTFEACTLFRISRMDFEKISDIPIYGEKIRRVAAEGLFVHKQNQQIKMLTQTAKERYFALQTTQPNILQRVPQKYVASYLGITPQSLSRIKAKITKD